MITVQLSSKVACGEKVELLFFSSSNIHWASPPALGSAFGRSSLDALL